SPRVDSPEFVVLRLTLGGESSVLHVCRDSHDGVPGIVMIRLVEIQMLADRIVAGKQTGSHGFADDHHAIVRFAIFVLERSSANDAYAEGWKVSWRDCAPGDVAPGSAFWSRPSFNCNDADDPV